jgi:mannose-1-phosphate guanylyltransferase
MADSKMVAVVMAGGSGTRFWPLSRKDKPKQYLDLLGGRTLIQQTIDRIQPLVSPRDTFVVSTQSQQRLLDQQLPTLGGWILEPLAKNTAPCLMLSLLELLRRGYSSDTVMIVLPADHHIANTEAFHAALELARQTAVRENALVTLGIKPNHAHTGYGYIEAGIETAPGVHQVRKFVEKPSFDKAAQYLRASNYFWNGGIFVWTLATLKQAFEKFCPRAWESLNQATHPDAVLVAYNALQSQPIDVAVMEKATDVRVVPVEMGWSDIGSWDALYRLLPKDAAQNALLSGETLFVQSQGCLIATPVGKNVAIIGAKNLIVIDTGDSLLITDRSCDQLVREAASKFDL